MYHTYKEYSPLVFWYDFYCLARSDKHKKREACRVIFLVFIRTSEAIQIISKVKSVYFAYCFDNVGFWFFEIIKVFLIWNKRNTPLCLLVWFLLPHSFWSRQEISLGETSWFSCVHQNSWCNKNHVKRQAGCIPYIH